MRKHAIQSTLYIRTSTYIHGVHRHYSAQPGSIAPPLPHARVPPPMLAHPATRLPRGTRRCRRSPRATATSGPSGPPACSTPTLVAAVDDEHVSCAREHASRECHGHQQPRDRGVRMGLGRGNVPDGRHQPRGCRQRSSETEASDLSSCVRGHGAFAPRPRPSAVWAGANSPRAQTAVFASLWPPQARAWGVTCSNVQSDSGR